MKKKIVLTVIAITLFTTPVFAKKVRIYDEKSHYRGYVEDGKIYDEKSHYKGHIEKSGKVYDEKSHYKGRIEREKKNSRNDHYEEDEY